MLHSNPSKPSNKRVRELDISNPTPIPGQEPTTVFCNRKGAASPVVADNTAAPTPGVRHSYSSATPSPLYSLEKPLPRPPKPSYSSEPAERGLSNKVSSNVDGWGDASRDTLGYDGPAVPDTKEDADQAKPNTDLSNKPFRYSTSVYDPKSLAKACEETFNSRPYSYQGRVIFKAFQQNPFGEGSSSDTHGKKEASDFDDISLKSEPPEETEPKDDMAGRTTVKISLFLSSFATLVAAVALIIFGTTFERYKSLEGKLEDSITSDAPSITPVTSPTIPPPPARETVLNPGPADDPTSVLVVTSISETSKVESSDTVTLSSASSSIPTLTTSSSSETSAPSSSLSVLLQPSDTDFLLGRSGVDPRLALPTSCANRFDHIPAHKRHGRPQHVHEIQAGTGCCGGSDSTTTSTSTTTTTTTTVTRTILT